MDFFGTGLRRAKQELADEQERRREAERIKREEEEKRRLEEKKRKDEQEKRSKLEETLKCERRQNEERFKQERRQNEKLTERFKQMEKEKMEEEANRRKIVEEFRWGPQKKGNISEEDLQTIRERILKTDEKIKLLLFGITGCGKSSFGNSCRTALKDLDKPAIYHHVACSASSVSKQFETAEYGNIKLTDMPGIYETEQIHSGNIEDIASGKVSYVTEITEQLRFSTELKAVSEESSTDCVVIVLKYDSEIPPQIKRQLDTVLSLAGKGAISCHLVLTHLDVCDPDFKKTENLSSIYDSDKVQTAVKRMSEETGFPPYAISFVKNYTIEHEANIYMKQHHLIVFDRIIHSALEKNEAKKTTERQRALYEDEQRRLNEAKEKLEQEKMEAMDMERNKRSFINLEMQGQLTKGEIYFMILVVAVAVLLIYISI